MCECSGNKGRKLKFISGSERCRSSFAPSSAVRALAVCFSLLLTHDALAAVNTFRQGVSGYSGTQDTYLEENTPTTSRGNENTVKVENSGGTRQQGLIRFDNIFGAGAGQIPFGSIINSATLTVFVTNTSASGAQIRLHRMLVTWPETATWNSMTGGIQTNNVEALSVHDAQVANPTSSGSQVITGLAAALQSWSYGNPNHGWAILNSSSDGWDFRSSEFSSSASRPLLTVNWSPGICPGGIVTNTNDTTKIGRAHV